MYNSDAQTWSFDNIKMLEFFSIFSKGGIVLWFIKFTDCGIESNLNALSSSILDGKIINPLVVNKNHIEYKMNNEFDLIYAVCYNKILELPYIKTLLSVVEEKFNEIYGRLGMFYDYKDFDDIFMKYLKENEDNFRSQHNSKVIDMNGDIVVESNYKIEMTNNLYEKQGVIVEKCRNSKKKNKKKKEARNWGEKLSKSEIDELDYSDKNGVNNIDLNYNNDISDTYLHNSKKKEQSTSLIYGYFKNLFGEKQVTEESLKIAMTKMMEHLLSKNVAFDIAEKVCKSVSDELIGKSFKTASGLNSLLRSVMELSITKIITPHRSINILDMIKTKQNNQPFVIVFCGVNGVGKSTNLAKIAYYLLSNQQRVLIAACDTFRSGAVEQLKIHVSRFNTMFPDSCTLFEKGYGKDSSGVATDAIRTALLQKYSVVLIDTAGRMQNNEPLMRSLGKLISYNKPDLVLFVAEALVGNDGVNQLVEFNRHLTSFESQDQIIRKIDAIILTKFDAVDDKVGAILSMTYTTGQPILFVGTGQTYKDLRTLDIDNIVDLLLN